MAQVEDGRALGGGTVPSPYWLAAVAMFGGPEELAGQTAAHGANVGGYPKSASPYRSTTARTRTRTHATTSMMSRSDRIIEVRVRWSRSGR